MSYQINIMPQVPKMKLTLSSCEILCPTCQHYDIGDGSDEKKLCPNCGQLLKWDWGEIDRKASKSYEYKLAKRYHPEGGGVTTEQLNEWKKMDKKLQR